MPFVEKWIGLEIMLNEISQMQKGKYHIFYLFLKDLFLNI